MTTGKRCPSCAERQLRPFYELRGVTVQSTALVASEREALEFPTGDIELAVCAACGFICNIAFKPPPDLPVSYEDQQGFSATFNSFAGGIAQRLVDTYDLHDKHVLEIGCGKGDFLALVCEAGNNRGVGIDPLCDPERIPSPAAERITVVPEWFSIEHARYVGDMVMCRHTLEHIPGPFAFLKTVRDAIGTRSTPVFIEVPDVSGILRDVVFWDIYYEHCSYFSPGSLARLFRRCDLDPTALYRAYDNQYLLIEGQPRAGAARERRDIEEDAAEMVRAAQDFAAGVAARIERWRAFLEEAATAGSGPVIWGSGSKCVAFLTTLGIHDAVGGIVDINPNRHGKYIPGIGATIRPPEYLKRLQPETVIVMNPVYAGEIGDSLRSMGLDPRIVTVADIR